MSVNGLTLYLIWYFWALPIQQQIKIWCHKYGQMGIQLPDCVENCGKRRKCLLRAISSFSTMFSKAVCCLLRWNEYLWSKGLSVFAIDVYRQGLVNVHCQSITPIVSNLIAEWLIEIHSILNSKFNTLPNDKILEWSKLKDFADDFKFGKNVRIFFKRVENTVGNWEIASYKHSLLFPMYFQKTCTANT